MFAQCEPLSETMNVDPRGVQRGRCTACSCDGYTRASEGVKCDDCGHPPAKHERLTATVNQYAGPQPTRNLLTPTPAPRPVSAVRSPPTPAPRPGPRPVSAARISPIPAPRKARKAIVKSPPSFSAGPRCRLFPKCTNEAFFDPNSGEESPYCSNHLSVGFLDTDHGLPAVLSSAMYVTDGSSDFGTSLPSYGTVQGLPGAAQASLWQQKQPSLPAPPPMFLPPAPIVQPSTQTVQSQLPTAAQLQPPSQPQPPPLLPDHLRCKYPMCNRKRYQESNGRTHEFCGKTHALEYQRLAQKGSHVSADMKCKTPQCPLARKPRDDGKGYFDYCSIACRDEGSRLFHSPSEPNLAHGETCSLPGCTRPRYVDPANGRVHDFCGRRHANKAHSSGITVNSCNLSLVSTGSQEFIQVQALFQRTWAKGACPAITCVFLITNLHLEVRWKKYKTQLPVQTIEQYYHGTKLTCDIVNQCKACTDAKCGVCGISLMGMDRRYIRQNINFQRFGHGFYFAPNSSKCHDYTQGVHTHRAMLQCDILPGKKHTLTRGDQKLTGPPPNCHSVYGQAGGDLNYEELVVYNPDCVMPRYIIVYQRDGVYKIAK